jgi:DNA topoisomerase-1
MLATQTDARTLGQDPETGRDVVARTGRYGPYVTEVLPEDSKEKPRTASLFKSMSPQTVTLEDALRLLTLPRVLGEHEGEPVEALNGRYGPYVKKGKETRSLETEEQLFDVSLEQALEILAKPKERRGRGQAAAPLAELGDDPSSGKPLVVKNGRFGPYVTDGEVNASLKKGDNPETLTIDRAVELLTERRARGPVTPKKTRKRAA